MIAKMAFFKIYVFQRNIFKSTIGRDNNNSIFSENVKYFTQMFGCNKK
jgi:hypothetical protein